MIWITIGMFIALVGTGVMYLSIILYGFKTGIIEWGVWIMVSGVCVTCISAILGAMDSKKNPGVIV